MSTLFERFRAVEGFNINQGFLSLFPDSEVQNERADVSGVIIADSALDNRLVDNWSQITWKLMGERSIAKDLALTPKQILTIIEAPHGDRVSVRNPTRNHLLHFWGNDDRPYAIRIGRDGNIIYLNPWPMGGYGVWSNSLIFYQLPELPAS